MGLPAGGRQQGKRAVKVVVAPDSFKESLSAREAAEAIAAGLCDAWSAVGVRGEELEIVRVPMADGGEGTVETILAAIGGKLHEIEVTGPLGEPVEASFGLSADGRTAVIEMASAAGLHLVPAERRDPTKTTTYGVGELIKAALDAGASRILVGIGGSSTTDGGTGCAQALGYRFFDEDGRQICEPMAGRHLPRLGRIEPDRRDARLDAVELIVACDVDNPLTGPQGAAAVYGPQKGADPQQVRLLDAGLGRLAERIRRDLGVDVETLPGAGAAGGLGAGLVAFCGGTLRRGVESVAEVVGLAAKIRGADLLITGEGKLDSQSLRGKVVCGLAGAAKEAGVPVVAIAGAVDGEAAVFGSLLDGWFSIMDRPMSLAEALDEAAPLLRRAAERFMRAYLLGRRSVGG